MCKKYLTVISVILVILTLLLSPDICISAAKEGLLLWFNKVLPSLLPFIILINILSQLNIMKAISTAFCPVTRKVWKLPGSSFVAFIMGFISGYPMGAKMIRESLNNGTLSDDQAQKSLCFSNNCGALFIIGTVGTLMLGSPTVGYFLLFIHIVSAILLSLIFSFYKCECPVKKRTDAVIPSNISFKFSNIFNESIKNAMDTIVYIGGYIIFFSVIARIITLSPFLTYILHKPLIPNISPSAISSFITGLLELSNGISMVSTINMPTRYTLAIISFLIGFGGLCVHFQTSYILGDLNFSLVPYIIAKFMQGVLSFILVFLFYPYFSKTLFKKNLSFEIIWLAVLVAFIISSIYIVKYLNFLVSSKSIKHSKTSSIYYCK